MNRKEFLKTEVLAAAAIITAPTLMSWIPQRGLNVTDLNSIVEKYYGNPSDVSAIGRTRKMQALIMEVAIKAKARNPNFQVIPQDTLQYAHIDGDENNPYDWKFRQCPKKCVIFIPSSGYPFTTLNNIQMKEFFSFRLFYISKQQLGIKRFNELTINSLYSNTQ